MKEKIANLELKIKEMSENYEVKSNCEVNWTACKAYISGEVPTTPQNDLIAELNKNQRVRERFPH